MRRRRLLPLLAFAVVLAAPQTASAAITEYSSGLSATSAPRSIVAGPDGKLWFTQPGGSGSIGQFDPATRTVIEFPTPTAYSEPTDIVAGDDGNLWFTEQGGGGAIARVTPTGQITEFSSGLTAANRPAGIAAGPDGNLWFTEQGPSGRIGRITPSGAITEFLLPDPGSEPTDIAAGSDGNLWFTERNDPGRIGRITAVTGAISEFGDELTPNSAPNEIVATSNGKLYFTEAADPGRVGRIRTDGRVEEYADGLTPNAAPASIAQGGDGALWFTTAADPGRIARLWPDAEGVTELVGGVATAFSADTSPAGITRGPDGNVWFTESATPARIGRVTVPPRASIGTPVALNDGRVRLRADVRPNSQPTTAFIEWGPTEAYGSRSADFSAGAGSGEVSVGTDVALSRDAYYHARVSATNGSGTAVSEDKLFYVTSDGEIVKEKPTVKPNDSSSTLDDVGTVAGPSSGPVDSPAPPALPDDHGDGGPLAPASPVLGHSVNVHPLSGSVFVKAPGAAHYVPLAAGASLRVGSLIDARRGHVVLKSARDAHGRTQTGTFWGAVFLIRQRRDSRGMTDLLLRGGDYGRCGVKAGASVLARETGGVRHAVRRLWGKDRHARFRTHGRDSVATVRGTEWVTTDRCDGTLTMVSRGKVLVRDLRRPHSVLLTAGHAYLARHRRP